MEDRGAVPNLRLSVTWLRLVSVTWLFVASSDNHASKISCWALASVFQGFKEPLAEAYLPGQVKTGKLEVQESGVVLALGLGVESPAVHMITLQRHAGAHAFFELSRIEGSSHVLMLCGNLLGLNWKDNRIYNIPVLDIPGQRSVPHLMTIQKNTLVVLRTNMLQIYTLPSVADDSVVLSKEVQIPTIWEVAVCKTASQSSPETSLRLIFLSPVGIEIWTTNLSASSSSSPKARDTQDIRTLSINSVPVKRVDGTSGCRHQGKDSVMAHILYRPTPGALPVLDIDEALGLTVIGNCFGELAIYDHVGRYPQKCSGLAHDFTDWESPDSSLMPTLPISLGLSLVPPPFEPDGFWAGPRTTLIWVRSGARTGFAEMIIQDGYLEYDRWQGGLPDHVWTLEHAYGFPGRVIPQGYMNDDYHDLERVLFRVGNRYLVYCPKAELDKRLKSWPIFPSNRNQSFDFWFADPESYTRRPAITEAKMYHTFRLELTNGEDWSVIKGRNRWIEQAERCGRPHENLLYMPPLSLSPQL
ncbi:hypothetical protein B0H14DRAFT_2606492 [Mycena olivaceomarginata]|nr:hypothetical protein B0H14DRAFT_2606492 [Mycena olivaceomarginata]